LITSATSSDDEKASAYAFEDIGPLSETDAADEEEEEPLAGGQGINVTLGPKKIRSYPVRHDADPIRFDAGDARLLGDPAGVRPELMELCVDL
jgi:hypothetical protein